MFFTAGLLSVVFLVFWGFYTKRDNKETVKNVSVIGLCTTWFAYLFFVFVNDNWDIPQQRYYFLLFIPVFVLMTYVTYFLGKPKILSIIAKQQNYWNVPQSVIYDYFRGRIVDKQDRKEVEINVLSKKFTRKYNNEASQYFTTNVYSEYKQLKLTAVKNLSDIKEYSLYMTVFLKIKGFVKYKEVSVDFEKILYENNMCLEYFLLDIWERYTKEFNIGTATLNVVAKREIEQQLVGALDNIDLVNVKRHGAALFYSYMKFKNRLPQRQEKMLKQTKNEVYDL
jgi:hypothetical protein